MKLKFTGLGILGVFPNFFFFYSTPFILINERLKPNYHSKVKVLYQASSCLNYSFG